MREELLKGLSKEQITRLEKCKDGKEILALAEEEGVELNDEQLEAINGGGCGSGKQIKCPNCGSKDCDTKDVYNRGTKDEMLLLHCNKCGNNFIYS